jgi:hypothetical protein
MIEQGDLLDFIDVPVTVIERPGNIGSVSQEEHDIHFKGNAKLGKVGQKRVADWLYHERGYHTMCLNIEVAERPEDAYKYSDIGDIYISKEVKMMNLTGWNIKWKSPVLVKPIRIEVKQTRHPFTGADSFPKFEATHPFVIVVAQHRHSPPEHSRLARLELPKPYCYIHLSLDGTHCAIMYSRDEHLWTVLNVRHKNYRNYGVDNYMMHKDQITWARLIDVKDP